MWMYEMFNLYLITFKDKNQTKHFSDWETDVWNWNIKRRMWQNPSWTRNAWIGTWSVEAGAEEARDGACSEGERALQDSNT